MTLEEFKQLCKDDWFNEYCLAKLTPEFVNWWASFYILPSDYVDLKEEQKEYWVRCSFALDGWIAAKQHTSTRI